MPNRLRFAVCTFDRVFDVTPKQETLTLDQLVTGLLRFELKPALLKAVERTTRQIEVAWAGWSAGEYRSGKQYARIAKAADTSRRAGEDPDAAARAEYEKLLTDAKGSPKRDLRLWAPSLYPPDSRRGSDNVLHVSCLVLDYDKGMPPSEALPRWESWFHVAHSTWSHTPEKPKFRVILPLASPVRPDDWRGVWDWAEGIAGKWIDPAMKGRGANFALPSSPGFEHPRIAVLHDQAPLLDPVAEGLITRPADPPPVVAEHDRPESHFNGGVVGHEYLDLGPQQFVDEPVDTLDVSGEWEIAPPRPAAPSPAAASPEPTPPRQAAPAPPPPEEVQWDERSDEWETLFEDL